MIPPSSLFLFSPCLHPSFIPLFLPLSLTHPPLKSVLSGWAGFMSGVIKRWGDEGQRGKERWRTEGDVGKRERGRDGDRKEWKREWARPLLPQTWYCPGTFLWHKMSVPFLSQGLFQIWNFGFVSKRKKNEAKYWLQDLSLFHLVSSHPCVCLLSPASCFIGLCLSTSVQC